jgi:hypothetical protein
MCAIEAQKDNSSDSMMSVLFTPAVIITSVHLKIVISLLVSSSHNTAVAEWQKSRIHRALSYPTVQISCRAGDIIVGYIIKMKNSLSTL